MEAERHAIGPAPIQASSEPGATRLAIAYDIVRRYGRSDLDAVAAAREVGRVIRAMLRAEAGKDEP